MDQKYTQKLESVIEQMLKPIKGIPFNLVINSLSGHKIIPFNKKSQKDIQTLKDISLVAKKVCIEVNKVGIKRPRPNEVGNDIEIFVKKIMNDMGLKANVPKTKKGNKKSTGYPDIEFMDRFNRINYLECKTYNIKNLATTQRSFYISPSEDFKISCDAHHFVISFEIFVEKNIDRNLIFKCSSWKILSIENLDVDVKYEFNADNARLYNKTLILAEGKM